MKTITYDDLVATAVSHLSMVRQIKSGDYKAKPTDLESRLTWLRNNYDQLRNGDELGKMVADEIDRQVSQKEPLSSQPQDVAN